jgi:hypothetical protein
VRRFPLLCCGAALTALLGATVPSGGATATGPTRAQILLSDALNAANDAGSMHFVDKTTANGNSQTLEGAISAPTASETLTSNSPLEIELIGGVIYVIGSEEALVQSLQISVAQAKPYAGKWIVVQQSDAPFQLLASTLTLGSTIDVFTPGQTGLKIGKTQEVGHIKAIPLVGISANLPKNTGSSVALFVSPKAPHLPLGGSLIVANKTGRLNEVAVFNDWGAKVDLPAPTGAVPFSTVLS